MKKIALSLALALIVGLASAGTSNGGDEKNKKTEKTCNKDKKNCCNSSKTTCTKDNNMKSCTNGKEMKNCNKTTTTQESPAAKPVDKKAE